ncbi:MAG TPA: response regulator [Candidatus Merdenecus merdavium]|nr:response regulator [Candidatus Merdenecus merdavium]
MSKVVLLIADDERVIRQGLLSMDWSNIGIKTVLAAKNGVEAKEYLNQYEVDIMISDIKMPGFTGLELSEYVRKSSANTAIILLSGFNDFSYAQKAIRSDVFDYLLKPIKPEELLKVVLAAKYKIEEQKYKLQVVEEYEENVGNFKTKDLILHSFRYVDQQTLEILKFMAEHYQEDLSLNTLAEQYHFTTVYLSRFIKKETGYSFVDILTCIRLLNVLDLLKENKYKIQIICEKVGFKDQRYFSQVFKKVFGCKPGEYNKRSKEKKYTIIELLDLKVSKGE